MLKCNTSDFFIYLTNSVIYYNSEPSYGVRSSVHPILDIICEHLCVEEDMSKLKLCVEDTHDRAVWRRGILGNCLTRAVARKNDVKG